MNLNNTVIKVLNEEHGLKVIKFYEKNGYNTYPYFGANIGFHYGVLNNRFSWYNNSDMERFDFKIIELPEEPEELVKETKETIFCMVHIIKNSEDRPIGWEMCPQTEEEHETVAIIRDLQFFGLNETYPSYNGLELIDPDKGKCTGNIKRISWLMRKYQNK